METQGRHIVIGLLALAGFITAALLAAWFADGDVYGERRSFELIFTEDVGGLSTRSPVRFNGITVGEVDALRIDPDDPRRVRARIKVGSEIPIHEDTRAQINTSSLFAGGAHIRLVPGDPEADPLRAVEGEPPRIETIPSPMARLREDSDKLLANINELAEQANRLLSEENVVRLGRTLEHFEQTAGAIAERRDDLGDGLSAWAAAGAEAEQALEAGTSLAHRIQALLDGPGEEILTSTARAAEALERGSEEAQSLFRDNRAVIERNLRGLQELEPALIELQQTLEALRSTVRRLEQDPGGRLLRRERMEEYQP